MKLFFALILLLILPSWAGATTYWVAGSGGTTAANCAAASGTSDPNFYRRTIALGKGCLGPGDTLIIKAGTYNEAIAGYTNPGTDGHGIPSGSSWAAPTTIKAQTPRTVTLTGIQDGNVVTFAPTVAGSCPDSLCTARYVVIEGLILDASAGNNGVRIEQSKIKLLNNEIKNVPLVEPGNCIFTGPGPDNATGDDLQIINNTVHNCGSPSGGGHGIYFGSSNSLIEGNEFYNVTNGWGIQLQYKYSFGNTVRKNKVYQNRSGIVISSFTAGDAEPPAAHDNLVYNNVIYNNTDVGIAVSYGGAQSANNNTVVSNTIYGHGYAGIRTFGGTGNIIRNNILSTSTTNFRNDAGSFTASNNLCSDGTTTANTCNGVGSNNAGPQAGTATFTNVGTYDLTLRAGSMAINNGYPLGSPYNSDFLGAPRPGADAGWDIGAYESGAPTPPVSPQLVLALPLDEGTGSTAADVSGQKNNATLVGGATWDVSGKYGKAVMFDGTGSLNVPATSSLTIPQAMTLEAWVYPTVVPSGTFFTVIFKDTYYLYASSEAGFCGAPALAPLGGYSTASTAQYLCATSAPPVNQWSYLAVTHDGTTLTFYLDGKTIATRTSSDPMVTSGYDLTIGASIYGENFIGKIDEPRVYNYARTPTQIVSDMNTPLIGAPGKYVEIAAPQSVEMSSASTLEIGAD